MIQRLALQYNKAIAYILFFSFYISCVSPLYAAAKVQCPPIGNPDRYLSYNYGPTAGPNNTPVLDKGNTFIVPPATATGDNILSQVTPEINVDESANFIGGPSQPEMSAFKSAGTNDMVNLFTGDFSYNIPLLDVGGYPVNIFYNGGITMEQEASWVGLGWNINPGTVSRNMRGVPDDFDGTEKLQQEQNIKPNITWGGRFGVDFEKVGIKGLSLGVGLGYSNNSYLGPALDVGVKAGYTFSLGSLAGSEKNGKTSKDTLGGSLSIGVAADLNSRNGLSINPNISLGARFASGSNAVNVGFGLSTSYNSRTGIKGLNLYEQVSYSYARERERTDKDEKVYIEQLRPGSVGAATRGSSISFAKPSYVPTMRMPITNSAYAGSFQLGGAIYGIEGSVEVEVYKQVSEVDRSDRVQLKPMIGYIYAHKAAGNPDAIMDYSRFNDKEVTPKTTVISVPQYAYDVFSISGEGTGGSIRAYRNDYGYVRDNRVRSKDKSMSFGADIGIPGQIGANFNIVKTPTTSGDWGQGNHLRNTIQFGEKTKLEEHVYFRNPGETSVLNDNQYENIGGTDLVRFKLGKSTSSPEVLPVLERFNEQGQKTGEQSIVATSVADRSKRTQVVNFLTAEEARYIGLDTAIRSYNNSPGTFPFLAADTLVYSNINRVQGNIRRPHHISEINVTESDGKRYVYGLPVYNIHQEDYTVTVNGTPDYDNDLVPVTPNELNIQEDLTGNKDGYKLITKTPPYAHSFLLSGLLSPDYVDVTGNGITEDDLGTAVKFNYTKMPHNYKWRTPYNADGVKAHFNDGNMSETRDDKGVVSYGERESWFMHSIESKTMLALFTLEDRMDAKGVFGVTANRNDGDGANKRLKKIDLYNKADLRKNGIDKARPIKTVWFEYDYSLCANAPDNNGADATPPGGSINPNADKGRLTLKGIYFTYNGQARAHKNKYVFQYGSSPSYQVNASDRWGNYKPRTQNPQNLKNSIHPYASQANPATSNANAAAWNLSKILLPAGGQLEIAYESDDYSYVQDRRATVMMPIAYLGRGTSVNAGNNLYDVDFEGTIFQNDKVYITVPQACNSKAEVREKYLKGINQLSFKLAVNMPNKKEYLTMYANVKDWGYVNGQSIIWIQLELVDGYSPLALTTLDFLREHLPAQAYRGYAPEGNGFQKFQDALAGLTEGIEGAFKNAIKYLMGERKAKTIVLTESFVRLNAPDMKKYGGGHRVKAITIKDNWNAMTGQYTSNYGQQYDYTTTENVNGEIKLISSGVASYEPSIGGEENPFQEIVQIKNRLPLGPANYEAIEMPVLDAFFPAPLVGYSKVTMRSVKSGTPAANHTKKSRSGMGKQVTEFYTAKDFPVNWGYTRFDHESDKQEHGQSKFAFFQKWAFDSRALSQGFKVELNDMHGKMKSQSSYAENDPDSRIAYTEYRYRNTGAKGLSEKLDFVHQRLGGQIKPGNMGVDIELMTDVREFTVKSNSTSVQAQVDWFQIGPLPLWLPFIWPTLGMSENNYRAVTTTKVINYHSVVDSVIAMDKGSIVTTSNLIYDAETGGVILSSTNNEFDRPVYHTSYPAYWAYSGMGTAYRNIDGRFSDIDFLDGKIVWGLTENEVKTIFESGDEIYIISGSPAEACEGIKLSGASVKKIWAMDKNKDLSSLTNPAPDFIFIDEMGIPYTRNNVRMRIVRSGKRNMLTAQLQSFVSRSTPDSIVNGIRRLIFEQTKDKNVLNSSALEYKEKWQTDKDVFRKFRLDRVSNGPNLIVNGDFSAGNSGFSTSYSFLASGTSNSNAGQYSVRGNSSTFISGGSPNCLGMSNSLNDNMLLIRGHVSNNNTTERRIWSQTVTVIPNRYYNFGFFVQSQLSPPGPTPKIVLKINGQTIPFYNEFDYTSCVWQEFRTAWNSGNITSAQVEIWYTCPPTTLWTYFALDNIRLYLVNDGFVESEDCSGYLAQQINPYRKGLLGTFRGKRNMLFYGERLQGQGSIGTATQIASDGVLKEFLPYWSFNGLNNLIPVTDPRWVWNSEVTRFNARGLELETKDALNMYTAAQYGYAKNLPIAITNNARYHEAAYVSFEDLDYKESLNTRSGMACVDSSHLYFDKNNVVNSEVAGFNAHSGRHMLKVNTNSIYNVNVKTEALKEEFSLQFLKDTARQYIELGGVVDNFSVFPDQPLWMPDTKNKIEQQFNFNGTGSNLIFDPYDQVSGGFRTHDIAVYTKRYLHVSATNLFTLQLKLQYLQPALQSTIARFREVELRIFDLQGNLLYSKYLNQNNQNDIPKTRIFTETLLLYKGTYEARFYLRDMIPSPVGIDSYVNQVNETITLGYDLSGPLFSLLSYKSLKTAAIENGCINTLPIAAKDSMFNPVFQVPVNKKMLLSTWVREQRANQYDKADYGNGKVRIIFRDSDGAQLGTQTYATSGPIIEGWQKIEGVFTAPTNAATMELALVNNSNTNAVYFDDLRIHPYAANMKSFVYDPVNLRLLAELDANNYSTFYEYDEEGGLIRTKAETYEGIKTIKETRSVNQRVITGLQ